MARVKGIIEVTGNLKGNANNSQYSYSIGKTTREALGGTLALPNHEAGDQLQVFLFFKSASGTEVSSSQYLGTITITE